MFDNYPFNLYKGEKNNIQKPVLEIKSMKIARQKRGHRQQMEAVLLEHRLRSSFQH